MGIFGKPMPVFPYKNGKTAAKRRTKRAKSRHFFYHDTKLHLQKYATRCTMSV